MLQRHVWFIVSCAVICLVASGILVKLRKPVYEASATLRIDPGRASSLGLSDLVAGIPSDTSDLMQTEIAILQSDGVALRTLNALPDNLFYRFAGEHKAEATLPTDIKDLTANQQRLIDRFKSQTRAKQVEGTQLIVVSFRSSSPQLAAQLVNQLVGAYAVQTFVGRDNSVTQLRTWLSAQMAALKDQVEQAQKKLAAFQQANDFVPMEGSGNTITDRLRLLNDRLAAAQTDRIVKQAQLRAAETGNPAALAALFPSAHLDAAEQEQAAINTKYAQLASKFGPKYPPLAELKQQAAVVAGEISSDVQSVRQRLQEEFDAAKSTEDGLQAEYDKQTELAYGFNRNQAEYAALQAEVTSSRELYDTLNRKLQQARVDAEVNGLNTMLVDSAPVPTSPVETKKLLILGSGLVLGLFSGIAAAFLFEATSDRLQNSQQIQNVFGMPALVTIPVEGSSLERLSSHLLPVTLSSPTLATSEAYRAMRNILLLSTDGPTPKTLLVTSALDGEGAEDVAANYAVSLAQAGFRVLAVDADLRNSTLHEKFGLKRTNGSSDVLNGHTLIRASPQPVAGVTNLSILTIEGSAGLIERDFLKTFSSLLTRWEEEFDFVVLQSAPLLAISDGLLLARYVSAVLVVTRYNISKLAVLKRLEGLLRRVDLNVVGVVMRDVPNASAAYRAQGDTQYA